MISTSQNHTLAKLNPIMLGNSIRTLCGDIDSIQHLKSGGLFVSCSSFTQVKKLLSISELPFTPHPIPVKVSVALNSQSVQGKIYAPELLEITLPDLLTALRPSGVIDVRKLLNDPSKAHVPLFVLTFFGSSCPQHVTLGFSKYRIDPFYPSPSRCSQCCRWGHTRGLCRGALTCSNCGSKGHASIDCPSQTTVCSNCGGSHSAFSRLCPQSIQEHNICQLKVKNNVSYPEARKIYLSSQTSVSSKAPVPSTHLTTAHTAASLSYSQFPPLRPASAVPAISAPAVSPSPWFSPQQSVPTRLLPQSPSMLTQMGPPSPIHVPSHASLAPDPQISFPSPSELPSTASLYRDISSQAAGKDDPPVSPFEPPTHHPPLPPRTTTSSCFPSTSLPPFSLAVLGQHLSPIIPVLMKLFLCSSLSSKIECVLEIASHLHLLDSVNAAISSLNLSSLSNSQ